MLEFAISAGEGTLLDYGMKTDESLGYDIGLEMWVGYEDCPMGSFANLPEEATVMFSKASPDCTTGQ